MGDVKKYYVDVTVMGDDWEGNEKFEALKEYCGFDKEQRLEAYKGLWNTYRLNK